VQIHPNAKILIAGQAPGSKVHKTGIPFDDPSGDRLREWMGIDKNVFYDLQKIAILPMGFCYPGAGKSGDLPPRKDAPVSFRLPAIESAEDLPTAIAALIDAVSQGELTPNEVEACELEKRIEALEGKQL